jgi:DNA polymerase-3 subunit delta'
MPFRLIGNARAVEAVSRSLARPSPPHSYLFAGPARTGKATLAIQLAQALNCTASQPSLFEPTAASPADGPCGECDSCRRIAQGIHADVLTVTIDRSEDAVRKSVTIEQVREIERTVSLAPYEGRMRVIIIDPADALTEDAQNAFLKTLEEPPPHAVFILVAAADQALLATVLSRVSRVEFRLAPAAEIEAGLLVEDVDAERAALLSRLAGGRPGWALEMARDEGAFEARAATLQQAGELATAPLADRFALAEATYDTWREDHDAVFELLDEWLGYWRDVMLIQAGAGDAIANGDVEEWARKSAKETDSESVISFVSALQDARMHLQSNVQPRLALENLMLRTPSGLIHAGRP